jgi:hypothetical protein
MGTALANKLREFDWTNHRSKAIHTHAPLRLLRRPESNRGSAALVPSESRPHEAASPKAIGILVFAQMSTGELMGAAEVFSKAKVRTDNGPNPHCYRLMTIGVTAECCVTQSGIIVKPQFNLQNVPPLDTLIIPGGIGIHDPKSTGNYEMAKLPSGQHKAHCSFRDRRLRARIHRPPRPATSRDSLALC